MLKVISRFLLALIAGYIVASICATQCNLSALNAMGIDVDMGLRLQATGHDIVAMASSYLILLLVAFAIAFPVAAGLTKWAPGLRAGLFILAGAVAVLGLHLLLEAVLGINGIAAVRTWAGMLSQVFAGAVAGACYAVLSRKTTRATGHN